MKLIILLLNLCIVGTVVSCRRRPRYVRALPDEFDSKLNFLVSVQDKKGNHLCLGALIKKIWVLTSASCLTTDQLLIEHTNGTALVKSVHRSLISDVVLLKLEKGVKSKQVIIAKIDFSGKSVTGEVTSFGIYQTVNKNTTSAKPIKKGVVANLNIVPQKLCAKEYASILKNKHVFCVTGAVKDCRLGTNQILVHSKTLAVIGLSTKTHHCNKEKKLYNGLFEYIANHKKWIHSVVGKDQ